VAKHSKNIFLGRKNYVNIKPKYNKDGECIDEGGFLNPPTALEITAVRLNKRDDRRELKVKRLIEANKLLLNGPDINRVHAV